MAEEISLKAADKESRYRELIPQLQGLLDGEPDQVANMGNVCAALKYGMGFLWVGFYLVKENELVLGPFQGPVACTRIQKGKGVCGTAWERKNTVIVPDVDQFEGHIACSSLSKSEIVIPLFNAKGEVMAVFDVDSEHLAHFDDRDEYYLKQILRSIQR